MNQFMIHKAPLDNNFLGVNNDVMGMAAGALKLCGLKLYIYLASNKDGKAWNLNPVAYANWLGVDYKKSGRAVRKSIEDGIMDLKENGYIHQTAQEQYEFSEQIVPLWQNQGTFSKGVEKEQIVPNLFGF